MRIGLMVGPERARYSTKVERMLRDAVGSVLYSGTSDIQRNIIARWLGL